MTPSDISTALSRSLNSKATTDPCSNDPCSTDGEADLGATSASGVSLATPRSSKIRFRTLKSRSLVSRFERSPRRRPAPPATRRPAASTASARTDQILEPPHQLLPRRPGRRVRAITRSPVSRSTYRFRASPADTYRNNDRDLFVVRRRLPAPQRRSTTLRQLPLRRLALPACLRPTELRASAAQRTAPPALSNVSSVTAVATDPWRRRRTPRYGSNRAP